MAPGAEVLANIRSKGFGDDDLLFEDLFLTVPSGQVVALIGPSGVGKSTLIRMIAGIDDGFEGEISIDGQPAGRASIPGFVFQDPRLLPWGTAMENIFAVKPDLDLTVAQKLFADMGLAGAEDSLPHELSGGMQRRVALARALAVEPRILLLDEPFVSVDRKLARELRGLLARVFDDYQPTVVLVTHDAKDAAELADRVIRLEGRPARFATDQMIDTPRVGRDSDFIARLSAELDDSE